MENVVSTESLRGNRRTWIIVEAAAENLRVVGCYEVSARRAEYLAQCVIKSGSGRYVVSIEHAPRYERAHH